MLRGSGGAYRDGPWRWRVGAEASEVADADEKAEEKDGTVCVEEAAWGDGLDTPVDMWWWLAFFHAGKRCGKVDEAVGPLFGWRQHPRQHTRTHGRLCVENLRKIKAHFLLRDGGPCARCERVVVVSTGETLRSWQRDLLAHAGTSLEVIAVEWKPPKKSLGALVKAGTPVAALALPAEAATQSGTVRLWAFGNAAVREKVRLYVGEGFDAGVSDFFVA